MNSFSSERALDPRVLWPAYRPTDLVELPRLAQRAGVARVFVKLENQRPLGNFKSLGGFCAGLRALARHSRVDSLTGLQSRGAGLPPLLCASEGNHGLAVAAAAQFAGAKACIYLPCEVSPQRVKRITALGSEVVRVDGTYDEAVQAAKEAAAAGAGLLIPDTSDDPNDIVVADVMDGYTLITTELEGQLRDDYQDTPTHAFIQAGVGGLAAAITKGLAEQCRWSVQLLTVEPANAPCVANALELGRPQLVEGDLQTSATMLACGVASAPAIRILLRYGARAVTVSEAGLESSVLALREAGGPATTTSGAAGLAGLLRLADDAESRKLHGLNAGSRVLLLVTEGPQSDDANPHQNLASQE